MTSYYEVYEPMIENLKTVNPNVDTNVSYGKALAQLVSTTWDTAAAVTSTLNAEEIKIYTENILYSGNTATYNLVVNPNAIKNVDSFLNQVTSIISFKDENEKSKFISNSKDLMKPSLFYLIL